MTNLTFEALLLAIQSIKSYFLRSLLSATGIAVSVGAMIAIVSIIEGFRADINKQFEGFGTDSITVQPKVDYEAQLKGKYASLKFSDLELIKRNISLVNAITPEMSVAGRFSGEVGYRSISINTDVKGTTESWMNLFKRYPIQGRFITKSDSSSKRKVCVIGVQVLKDLELPENPIGEYILIENEWFKVVGVLEKQGRSFGINQDDLIIIPFSTALNMSDYNNDANFWIQMRVKSIGNMGLAISKISDLLKKNHGISDDDKADFEVLKADQFMDSINQITSTITFVLGGIVSVSMIVGGIGIMNIMIMSVTERTREIGIAKALGASRSMILKQFLFEAIILSIIGGIIGVCLGYVLAHVLSLVAQFPPPIIPLWSILMALIFSIFIGLFFGILPAAKAANLEPIEALRQ